MEGNLLKVQPIRNGTVIDHINANIALKIIQKELDLTMAMCGETNISNAGMHNLHHNPFK